MPNTHPYTFTPLLTPEKAPRLHRAIHLQLPPNAPHGPHCLSTGHIAREQHVEVVQPGLSQPLVQLLQLGGRGLGAADLGVGRVVAVVHRVDGGHVAAEGLQHARGHLVADIAGGGLSEGRAGCGEVSYPWTTWGKR